MIGPVTLVRIDPCDGSVLCDGCDCLDLATHALELHRRATAFQGQHYSAPRQFLCAVHLGELTAALAYEECMRAGVGER
jgi:hypothetical protein